MDYRFDYAEVAITAGLPGMFLFTLIYFGYLRIRGYHAFLLSITAMGMAMGLLAATRGSVLRPMTSSSNEIIGSTSGWLAMVMLGVGLLGKMYRVWILDKATEAEREPNGKGVRAWLSVGNLVMGMIFVMAAYVGRQWDPVGTAMAVVGLLLAYPATNCVLKGGEKPVEQEGEALAEERRRVLAMVEAGKISGEDGAELIGALGQSRVVARDAGASARLTGNMRVMMLGAALVVVGFCLPWFSVDLGARMQEQMSVMQQAMPVPLPPGYSVQVPTATRTVLEVRGGDVEHGLGWIILAMAGAVAVMPLVWVGRGEQRETLRAATIVGLLVGSVLVVYLVSFFYREMSVGMVLVLAGYGVMWLGVMREYVRPRERMVAVAG